MHRSLFHYSFLFLALGLGSAQADAPAAASAAGPVSSAKPAGLDLLAAYAGRWKTEIHYLDTPYSQKGDTAYELRNDCWRSAGYYACDQYVGGDSKALLVFTFDPKDGYLSYPITPGSGLTLHAGHLIISGAVWTFPWQVMKDGKTTYFHVLNTWASPDSIEFRQEYSADGKGWTLMAQGHEARVKA
jgi:hypothetical protein